MRADRRVQFSQQSAVYARQPFEVAANCGLTVLRMAMSALGGRVDESNMIRAAEGFISRVEREGGAVVADHLSILQRGMTSGALRDLVDALNRKQRSDFVVREGGLTIPFFCAYFASQGVEFKLRDLRESGVHQEVAAEVLDALRAGKTIIAFDRQDNPALNHVRLLRQEEGIIHTFDPLRSAPEPNARIKIGRSDAFLILESDTLPALAAMRGEQQTRGAVMDAPRTNASQLPSSMPLSAGHMQALLGDARAQIERLGALVRAEASPDNSREIGASLAELRSLGARLGNAPFSGATREVALALGADLSEVASATALTGASLFALRQRLDGHAQVLHAIDALDALRGRGQLNHLAGFRHANPQGAADTIRELLQSIETARSQNPEPSALPRLVAQLIASSLPRLQENPPQPILLDTLQALLISSSALQQERPQSLLRELLSRLVR